LKLMKRAGGKGEKVEEGLLRLKRRWWRGWVKGLRAWGGACIVWVTYLCRVF